MNTLNESIGSEEKQGMASGVIFAAGGVIRRQAPRGTEVLIIHRSRYGDWCLPKGKLKDKESFEQAAIREVREETGCDVQIQSFAGTASYRVKGTPKIVHFWNMEVQGECEFKPSEEVDGIEWLTLPEALMRLDYSEERRILSSTLSGGHMMKSLRDVGRFKWFGRRRRERLAGAIAAYRVEIDYRLCTWKPEGKENPCWYQAITKLLEDAEEALRQKSLEVGWKCFHAAQRMEIFGAADEELEIKANTLRQEAEKLGSWRKRTTYDLLGRPEKPKNKISEASVYQAALIRDEHFHNVYYKIGMLQDQLTYVILLSALAVGAILILAFKGWFPLGDRPLTHHWNMLVSVLLMGFLGANFSAIFSLMAASGRFRIPEATADYLVTMMRVSIGAISALAIYLLLSSEFFGFVFAFEVTSSRAFLFIAFASGFSERLVKRALDTVVQAMGEGKKQASDEQGESTKD